ncbi:MAG: YlxR family protein [Polyangia bacterium]
MSKRGRTCVGCRLVEPKAAVVRLVRDRRGQVVVDRRGILPGRGAYLHRRRECVTQAVRSQAFARSFRGRIFTDPARDQGDELERLWVDLSGERDGRECARSGE